MRWLRSGMPVPALKPCDDDGLPDGVSDLRGRWKAVRSEGVAEFMRLGLGQPRWLAAIAPVLVRLRQEERIEQCGLQVAITGGSGRRWVVHEFTADGAREHGVDDITIGGRPVRATGIYGLFPVLPPHLVQPARGPQIRSATPCTGRRSRSAPPLPSVR